MQVGFVLPSCNYNLVLSEADIKQLLDTGYISIVPRKTSGTFRDDRGVTYNTSGHELIYTSAGADIAVQYVGIAIDYHNQEIQK